MINNVTLVGRLARDPDMRYTPNGVAVVNFTLAVNRPYRNQNGENQADFIQCVTWRKSAEALAQHQRKGNLIGVTGSIQTRNYENEQGQRVYVTEVLANSVQFLEPANRQQNQGQNQGQINFQNQNPYQQQQQGNNNQPNQGQGQGNFQQNQQQQGQQQGNFQQQNQQQGQPEGSFDISDDNLPF